MDIMYGYLLLLDHCFLWVIKPRKSKKHMDWDGTSLEVGELSKFVS